MKLVSKLQLKKKLKKYQIIIFDLDDTIYPQKNYDNPALISVSKYLSKKIILNEKKIFLTLRRMKPIRRGKKPNKIFDSFLKKFSNNENKKLINKTVSIFQRYQCKELKKSPSLKKILIQLSSHKELFLVTNGNHNRQFKKIKYLGISKYFKKIFILDGKKKKLKPSIKNVKYLTNYLKKYYNKKAVFVGDNFKSDKEFAKNLKISFIHFEFS